MHPSPNPKEKGLKSTTRNSPRKRLQKSPKNEKWERDHQALRNHAESSILPRRFIQGLACLPSSIPLSRSHHEALKLVLEISKENGRGK
jgi:hypothetical protein